MRTGSGPTRLATAFVVVVVGAAALGACADEDHRPSVAGVGDVVVEDGEAWTHLGVAESTLPELAAAAVVEDPDELADAWAEHGFESDVPSIGFDDHVVVLLGLPDDACPDELIGLEVVDGALEAEWLPPPGACEQPLLLWLHAVQVHRGLLTESFTYGPPAPFEDELRSVTLELPPYEGVAPPSPVPPQAMDDADLDEVFAGHAVQRCGPEHEVGRGGEVDGPLSDDPEVAAAQRGRAEHGLPSDEAAARQVMDDPDALPEYGFPLLPEEQELDMAASESIEEVRQTLEADGWDLEDRMPDDRADDARIAVPMIDRSDGIRAAVVVGADDEAAVRELLARELGDVEVHVVVSPWDPAEVGAAQQALTELMGPADGPGSITWISGAPGPVRVGMIDPTRDALDRIADDADPQLVCVEVELSGVEPAG